MTPAQQRAALLGYLHAKIADADWHAVSDVANDLRVLEASTERETMSIDRRRFEITEAYVGALATRAGLHATERKV